MNDQDKMLSILEEAGITREENAELYNVASKKAGCVDALAFGFNALKAVDITFKENKALYEALIQNAYHAESLASGFIALKTLGATLTENAALYDAAIQKASFVDKLAIGFNALQAVGATLEENAALYEAAVQMARYADNLTSVFNALQAMDITLKENEALYDAAIRHPFSPDRLAIGFNALTTGGITLKGNEALYKALIQSAHYAAQLASGFIALKAVGATLRENDALYDAAIHNEVYADRLTIIFNAFEAVGATLKEHEALYKAAIQQAINADKLVIGFNALKAVGATLKENEAFYKAAIQNAYHANKFAIGFNALEAVGATLKEHEALYEALIQNAEYANELAIGLNVLKAANITLKENAALYTAVMQNARYADKLAKGFCVLQAGEITLKENEALYQVLIHNACDADKLGLACNADKLAIGFNALKAVGATFKENESLYQAAIQKAGSVDKLARGFDALKAVGATLKENEALYKAVIQKAEYADKLASGFDALQSVGAIFQKNESLYTAVIQEAAYADRLAIVFNVLKAMGVTPTENAVFYNEVIQKGARADQLASGFDILQAGSLALKENEALYNILIQNAFFADKLASGFTALIAVGLALKENGALYNALIQNAFEADKLANGFNLLQSMGVTPDEREVLYNVLIQNAFFADKLASGFNALIAVGATREEREVLYKLVIQNVRGAGSLKDIFNGLNLLGLSLKEDFAVYELAIQQSGMTHFMSCLKELNAFPFKAPDDRDIILHILFHSACSLDVFRWFNAHGFTYDAHRDIFHAYFTTDSPLMDSPYLISKVNAKLHAYLIENPLLSPSDGGYAAQSKAIRGLIDGVINADKETLTEGPLNKSSATRALEEILKRMMNVSIDDVQMRFDEAFGYVLQFGEEPELYINELLRRTNFNHIELSEQEVNLLGQQIQAITQDFEERADLMANIIVKKLPDAARRAISSYASTLRHKNMNALFRGVEQTLDKMYTWKSPVNGKANLIANFLAGCLVNWAAVELPRVLIRSEERRILEKVFLNQKAVHDIQKIKKDQSLYLMILNSLKGDLLTQAEYDLVSPLFEQLDFLFPSYSLIDRGENLTASGSGGTELETVKRRLANPVIAPSVLSFSVLHEGSPCFRDAGTTRTKVETDNSTRTVVNTKEGEILVPAGTSYLYTRGTDQVTYFAREINSPGILPHGGFWSSTALAESYRNHLRHPYKEVSSQEGLVQRPNHGLAHTYRVVVYLDVVIDYFALHAKDKMFRVFCQHITPDEREWLRVAAAFSISGRESEISAGMDPKRYDEFRRASQSHMATFLESYPPPTENAAMRERMLDIVRWMGNPDYEKTINVPSDKVDEDEYLHRNFIHRILSIAHKLDLPRCYNPAEFEQAMVKCRELSTEDDMQPADYTRMIRYAIDLIKAHGSSLNTDITSTGELQPANKNYTEPFAKVSQNLRQLREMTDTITQPQQKESYQFSETVEKEMMDRVLKMCGEYHPYVGPKESK